ncbi:MAG: CoA transferase [Actinomycetota bacterium]|nr:CoA transferase [Actinomycetota bacterium]
MSAGPLSGLRVLDLTRLLPGGYATLLLADMGADVLKVEEPGKGDYIRWTPPLVGEFSAAHIALNRNKRSMTLNLKSEAGRELFLELADAHDVVVESFRPGVLERLGVGWSTLAARNPRVVYCAISGYGQDGPRAQEAGHDANYIGYAGLAAITGEEGRRPVLPGVQIGDLAGGGMGAVVAILAALNQRERTGRGEFCDISMMDGAMSWLTIHAASFVATGAEPEREQMHLSGAYPCYRVYPARDGYLTVGALEPQFWAALCDAIERPDLRDDAFAAGDRRNVVIAELEGLFSTKTRAQWVEHFGGRDVCVAPVNGFGEALADPQARARAMAFEADVPGAPGWTHVGDPLKFSGSARKTSLRLPPPRMGEHTDEVLRELGRDVAAIEALRGEGAI